LTAKQAKRVHDTEVSATGLLLRIGKQRNVLASLMENSIEG